MSGGIIYAPTIGDLNNMPQEDIDLLVSATAHSNELFASIFCSHIITHIPNFHKQKYANYDELDDGKISALAEIVHRGSAKTTVKEFHTAKKICHNQTKLSIYLSETEEQVESNIDALKILLTESPMIQKCFGDMTPHAGDVDNKLDIRFPNGSRVKGYGYNSSFRGINDRFNRPDEIDSDDFEGDKCAISDKIRNKVYNIITNVIAPLGNQNTKMLFQGTIVHPEAYLANVLDKRGKHTRPAMFCAPYGKVFTAQMSSKVPFSGQGKVWWDESQGTWACEFPDFGDPIWSEEQGLAYIQKEWLNAMTTKNGLNYWGFLQERYNIPKSEGNAQLNVDRIEEHSCVFKSEYGINYLQYTNGQKVRCRTFIGVDNASSLNAEADRTSYFIMAKTYGGHEIILEIKAGRFKLSERIDNLYDLVRRYRPEHVTIETYGFQNDFADIVEQQMKERKMWFVVKRFAENKGSKSSKYLESLVPVIDSGKVGIIHNCPGGPLYKQEAMNFSGGVRDHDDTLDSHYLCRLKTQDFYVEKSNVDVLISKKRQDAMNKNKKYRNDSWMSY